MFQWHRCLTAPMWNPWEMLIAKMHFKEISIVFCCFLFTNAIMKNNNNKKLSSPYTHSSCFKGLKGTVHLQIKQIFHLSCSAIYPSRLFWCDFAPFGDMGHRELWPLELKAAKKTTFEQQAGLVSYSLVDESMYTSFNTNDNERK